MEHASIMETCPNPNQHNLNLLFLNTKCRENAATHCMYILRCRSEFGVIASTLVRITMNLGKGSISIYKK